MGRIRNYWPERKPTFWDKLNVASRMLLDINPFSCFAFLMISGMMLALMFAAGFFFFYDITHLNG